MKKRIYISGAISHHDLKERQQVFKKAQDALEYLGFEVVNPFNNGVNQEEHYTVHMRADIKMLLACDAIYMLPGWETSKGAKLELDVATSCGLRLFCNEQTTTLIQYKEEL